ncbi:acetate--CoA ligase [Nonlabens ulvanivorans]|uniref:acetate--CoA ligase n=3 Tax=Nonlabens ulvanivorans TaxID=906888 RepID=UPI003263B49B
MNYDSLYKQSLKSPELFWKTQSNEIEWFKKPQEILSKDSNDYYQWFKDGTTNLSYLCIDKHINDGYGEQLAVVYDSPVTHKKESFTFNQLYDEVSRLAGGLKSLGLEKGDTCLLYMPMIPQAVFAMLACARLGVIHSVVFGGFAPHELAIRINDCKPKAIITASHGIEINRVIPYKPFVDIAIEKADFKPEKVILFKREEAAVMDQKPYDVDYQQLVADSKITTAVELPSTHPSYILYTSGTTGTPKGIIRDTGGYATALKFSMKKIYGVDEGETYWAASDVGWVVGHSYIVYGPLINRNTTILFEGKPIKTPDASTFWRVISEHNVSVMFTAPTAIRAIKKEDPDGEYIKKYDLSSLKYQFLAGERCDAATLLWTKKHLGIPVIDHWWQTESGWPMLANMVGVELLESKVGSAGKPVCGYDIQILNENGLETKPDEEGYIAIKLPLPPGTLKNIWGNTERFKKGYLERFPDFYFSGDGGYKDSDGYVFVTGRVDDIINVAGHRLSTAEMEEVVSNHTDVAECAVFGIHCDLKGQQPLGLIVLKSKTSNQLDQIQNQIVLNVREEIGAVASLRNVLVVNRLPKTRSGKIMRKLLRNIADVDDFKVPSTLNDIQIISEIQDIYKSHRIGKFQ